MIHREGDPRLYLSVTADNRIIIGGLDLSLIHISGSIGLFLGGDVYRKSAELGYWLAEDYWGRGVMTAAVKQLCAEVFSRWDIARIYAEPFARNTGSRRVLEKAGFTLEGIRCV